MKFFLSIVSITILTSCALIDPPGCETDAECRDPRICSYGECVDPNSEPSSGPGGDDSSIGDECGSIQIECNCEYVDAYDGQTFPTDACDSGYVIVTTSGCYQQCYTPTWQAVCGC